MRDWTVRDIEQRFLGFMAANGHAVIDGHSVRSPTDDVLFTTAGMHPLTPFLEGEPHPAGRRLTDVQRCVRTSDVDEVGDNRHLTVFEMLGNWSLGDYFKDTSIALSFRLLTEDFGLDPAKLYVTVFAGADGVPADEESPALWAQLFADAGVDPAGRITAQREDNWWSNGPVGLCGPDTEIFAYVGAEAAPVFADTPQFVEIWNNVFMTYTRDADGTLHELEQRNVDTGMGLERVAMFLNRHTSVWQTDELSAVADAVAAGLGVAAGALDPDQQRSLYIVADHLRAGLTIAAAGIYPAATQHGYVLRKLIRRAVRHAELLTGTSGQVLGGQLSAAADGVASVMGPRWPDIGATPEGDAAREVIDKEAAKFAKSLRQAVKHLHEVAAEGAAYDGELAFRLADARGYPPELSVEEAERIGMHVDPDWQRGYQKLLDEQRARSRR